jgi:hypothetical protein
MSGPKHWPLIAWSKQELLNELWRHEQAIKNLHREFERRGERDDKRHGFPVTIQPKPGVLQTAYRHFPTAVEAYDAARAESPDDESAPYRVHPVYLGKDDPA